MTMENDNDDDDTQRAVSTKDFEDFKNEIREAIKALGTKQEKTTEKTTSTNGYVTFLTGVFIWALNKAWGWVHAHFFGS